MADASRSGARTPTFVLLTSLVAGVGCGGSPVAGPTVTAPALPAGGGCGGSGPVVAVLVDPAIASGVRASLTTFEADLCGEGYAVVESVAAYAAPPDLRRHLARVHSETQGRLQGAILVGNHPRAYQWVTLRSANPQFPSTSEEAISYSPTSMVLAAKGTTNNSGGMGNNRNGSFGHNLAVVLNRGGSLGEGLLDHVNVPLIEPWASSREFHFATSVVLGDATIKLRP